MTVTTCSKCGILYDTEIRTFSLYKEYQNMGCRIYKKSCPLCKHNEELECNDSGGYAFTYEEREAFLDKKEDIK